MSRIVQLISRGKKSKEVQQRHLFGRVNGMFRSSESSLEKIMKQIIVTVGDDELDTAYREAWQLPSASEVTISDPNDRRWQTPFQVMVLLILNGVLLLGGNPAAQTMGVVTIVAWIFLVTIGVRKPKDHLGYEEK